MLRKIMRIIERLKNAHSEWPRNDYYDYVGNENVTVVDGYGDYDSFWNIWREAERDEG